MDLSTVLDELTGVSARIDNLAWLRASRHDDAGFDASKHPRGPDGKFTNGAGLSGGAAIGAESYEKTLKKHEKGSAAGLMKHMIMSGEYSKEDIFAAASAIYGTKDQGHVGWYVNDLKKKGQTPPPLPKTSTAKAGEAKAAEPPKAAEAPKAAEPPKTSSKIKVTDKASFKNAAAAFSSIPGVKSDLDGVAEHFDNLTAENKPKVASKMEELHDTLLNVTGSANDQGDFDSKLATAFSKIQPIDGLGLSVSAVNSALAKIKAKYAPPAADPSAATAGMSPKQAELYSKLAAAPHYKSEQTHWLEDHEGKEVKTRLVIDTKKIPGDAFAKVTSAYGGKPTHANATSSEVNQAMQTYAYNQYASLTPEEQKALNGYKDGTYGNINTAVLNGGEMSPSVKKAIERLDSAIDKSYLPAGTPAWRGLSCSLKDLSGFDDLKESEGRVFEHKNYASISRRVEISRSFAGWSSDYSPSVLLKMTVPAGAKGVVLGDQMGGEDEIVLPRRCSFRIDSVEKKKDNKWICHVTYVGVREDG